MVNSILKNRFTRVSEFFYICLAFILLVRNYCNRSQGDKRSKKNPRKVAKPQRTRKEVDCKSINKKV